jgi:hypothetical protein
MGTKTFWPAASANAIPAQPYKTFFVRPKVSTKSGGAGGVASANAMSSKKLKE